MMKLWTFFWGHHNWTFFGGGGDWVINIIYIYFLGLFLKVKVQNWRMLYVKYFWGMPDVPDIFLEVNSR